MVFVSFIAGIVTKRIYAEYTRSIERTQHSWRRENKFSCRQMLCAIRVNVRRWREHHRETEWKRQKWQQHIWRWHFTCRNRETLTNWMIRFFPLCSALLRVNVLTVNEMRRLLFTHFYFFVTQMGSKFIRTNFNASIKSTVSMDRHRHRIRCHLMHSEWLQIFFTWHLRQTHSANKKLWRNRGPCLQLLCVEFNRFTARQRFQEFQSQCQCFTHEFGINNEDFREKF